jgi:hypothetical protein
MAYKTSHDGQERIMHYLADSVFELSDEEILAEVQSSGIDPQKEADHTTCVLGQAVNTWESENERLSNLGHTINPNDWRCVEGIYWNYCPSCGSLVSFSTTTQRMEGNALDGSCSENGYTIKRREASR